jgi:hypothetical protein
MPYNALIEDLFFEIINLRVYDIIDSLNISSRGILGNLAVRLVSASDIVTTRG